MSANSITSQVSIQKASVKDVSLIAELANEIWREYYPAIITMEQVEYMLNKMYSIDALENQIKNGQNFYFIESDGKHLGFISVSKKTNEEIMLHKFYVKSMNRKCGVGSKVFENLVEELNQPEIIRLTVNRQNFKSINFYFKNGFIIEKVEDFDIGNGYYMNDFVMIWKNAKNLN
ncbi:MAG: GNAT family N-acetyltransferase [Bacteroidota bacterium]|jgi:ribosomal protein S18 acetylase RimI-like enzyme